MDKKTFFYLYHQLNVLFYNIACYFIALRAFLKDISAFDKVYPGGLKFYVEKCRDLLTKSSQGANPFSGWTPSVSFGICFLCRYRLL